jgi:hypothetical protein
MGGRCQLWIVVQVENASLIRLWELLRSLSINLPLELLVWVMLLLLLLLLHIRLLRCLLGIVLKGVLLLLVLWLR